MKLLYQIESSLKCNYLFEGKKKKKFTHMNNHNIKKSFVIIVKRYFSTIEI